MKKVLFTAALATVSTAQFKEDNFMEPQQNCPKGFDFAGGECVRTSIIPPVPTCPKGYQQDKGGCYMQTTTRADPICPEGYQITSTGSKKSTGITCIRADNVEPDFTCPLGFDDTGNGCERRATRPAIYTNIPDISECQPEYQCPPGSMNDGKQCVSETIVPKQSRMEVHTEDCPMDDSCGYGFVKGASSSLSSKGGMCERIDTRAKLGRQTVEVTDCDVEVTCPKGSRPEKDGCIMEMTTDKIVQRLAHTEPCDLLPFCPEGFTDSGKGCSSQRTVSKIAIPRIETVSVPADYICPDGGELDPKTNLCLGMLREPVPQLDVNIVPCERELVCPKGYTLSGGGKDGGMGGMGGAMCTMLDMRPMINNPFTQVVPCEMDYVCPPGARMEDEECVVTQNVDYVTNQIENAIDCPTYSVCPPGSTDIGGGECIINNQVPAIQDCVQIPVPSSSKDSPLSGKESGPEYTLQCSETCPKDTTLISKGLCGSQQSVSAIQQCGAGCGGGKDSKNGGNIGGKCVGVEYVTIQECPKGFTDSGKGCFREDRVPMMGTCPKGCNSGSGKGGKGGIGGKSGECMRNETIYTQECPKGYEPSAKSDGMCELLMNSPAMEICPAECSRSSGKSKKNKKGFVDEGCFRTEVNNIMECPKGYEEVEGGVGKNGATSKAGFMCRAPSRGGPVPYCPKGSTATKSGECIQSIASSDYECPKGAVDVGKGCLETAEVPYNYGCPKECQTVGKKGKKGKSSKHGQDDQCFRVDVEFLEVCPKGYEDMGKQCVLNRVVQPNAFCPKECSMSSGKKGKKGDSNRCMRVQTHTIYECPKGYEDNGKECTMIVYEPSRPSCPKGCEMTKSGCITTSIVPFEECPKGTTDTGKGCVTNMITRPYPVCPKGCQAGATGKKGGKKNGSGPSCYQVASQEIISCPKGYEEMPGKDNKDVVCGLLEMRPYTGICPKGYQPTYDNKGGSGGKKGGNIGNIVSCSRMDIAPAEPNCPKGTAPVATGGKNGGSMKGSSGMDQMICQAKDYVEAEMVCVQGVLGKDGCEFVEYADPIITCPKGAQSKNGICV